MDLDKLSLGEKIAGLSSIVLFIFLFFDWFEAEISGGGLAFSEGISGWDLLGAIPTIVLLAAILAAVAVAVLTLMDMEIDLPVAAGIIVAVLGGISFIIILIEIVDSPDGGPVDISPTIWIFISLIASAGIAYGGYKAMQEEGASFGEVGDRFGGGGGTGGGYGGGGGHAQQPPAHQPPPAPQPPQAQPPQPPADPGQPPAGQTPPPPPPPPPAQ
jgi:hypothetical protein